MYNLTKFGVFMKKNRLAIIANFGPYSTIGGSEAVLMAVAEGLTEKYDYEVDIYAHNYINISKYNNINLLPCPKGDKLISLIAHNYFHILIYSDSQWNWGDIVRNVNIIDCRVSCALVGGYYLQSHPKSLQLLKENIDRFNIITHSAITPDYKFCIDNDLPAKVIPNGVELNEFNNSIDFKNIYKIKQKHIILNVGNHFFGKGGDYLGKISNKLREKRDDFIFVQISSTIKYPYDKSFLARAKKEFNSNDKCLFLRDIPREDVVAAFKCSDVFIFPSLKEVAPLVILEAQAAELPWIAMDVGNVKERQGGIIINNNNVDNKGYKIINEEAMDKFVSNIEYILDSCSSITGQSVSKRLGREGRRSVEKFDWENIVLEYDKVFNL